MITLNQTLHQTLGFLQWTTDAVLSEIKDYGKDLIKDSEEFYTKFSQETKKSCDKIKSIISSDKYSGIETAKEVLKEVLKMLLEQVKCVQKYIVARKTEFALLSIAIPTVGKVIAPIILVSSLLIYALDKIIKKSKSEETIANTEHDVESTPDSKKMDKYPKLNDLAKSYSNMDITPCYNSDISSALTSQDINFIKASSAKLHALEKTACHLSAMPLNSKEDITKAREMLATYLKELTTEFSILSQRANNLCSSDSLLKPSTNNQEEGLKAAKSLLDSTIQADGIDMDKLVERADKLSSSDSLLFRTSKEKNLDVAKSIVDSTIQADGIDISKLAERADKLSSSDSLFRLSKEKNFDVAKSEISQKKIHEKLIVTTVLEETTAQEGTQTKQKKPDFSNTVNNNATTANRNSNKKSKRTTIIILNSSSLAFILMHHGNV
ncbi:hypothetical protein OCHUTO_0543 [Orientia chuto str. Dubai]|uniref:Uncharacterized protein n=1 Tax=Orientia chuto str. Dubai TaxID=1359168 RepID=A0A0F3MKV3_9RICK|nr:hypothetical protein [Candidatus Orientia mediorientalis]KJV56276.1 hypothetical protein OCHUTO_0543 [Orientia chuto str. Dubai]